MLRGRSSLDLAVTALLALVGLLAAILAVDPVLRTALLLPLVLFLPGYALCAVVLPPGPLPPAERAVYSVAVSIALTVIGAMVVQFVFSLDRDLWAVVLATITIALCAVAHRRRAGLSRPFRSLPALPQAWPVTLAGLITAAALAGWSISVASTGTREQDERAGFTALWLLQESPRAISVGVSSHQRHPVDYTLRVNQGGRPLRVSQLRLLPGEVREPSVEIAPIATAGGVEAILLRGGGVYRRTYLNREGAP